MNIENYKKQFAELFMRMEQEHGWCKSVNIEHDDECKNDLGQVMSARVDVKIEF